MWALLLLPIVLLVLYFAQRLLFRRLWDENLTVQISFDRDYIFCGEEANLVETIVNNKYLDRKSTRLNSSHRLESRMPSSA